MLFDSEFKSKLRHKFLKLDSHIWNLLEQSSNNIVDG